MSSINFKSHWNKTYQNKDITKLGWYQDKFATSLGLIEKANLDLNDKVLIVGAGASLIVDVMIDLGFTNLIVTDISEVALEIIKERLGSKSSSVEWIIDDLTDPTVLMKLNNISFWYDRAVLHFLTQELQSTKYLELLEKIVKINGHIMIATFSLEGAKKCSGLDVKRYSTQSLQDFLGSNYRLVESTDYLFTMPSGDIRSYVYVLIQRIR